MITDVNLKLFTTNHSTVKEDSVERANQDVDNMLTTWMQTGKNFHWSQGLEFL